MEDEIVSEKKSKLWLWIVLIVIIAVILTAAVLIFGRDNSAKTGSVSDQAATKPETAAQTKVWQDGEVAIAGKYADADIVDLGGGQYRLYYAAEPEIAGFNGQIYSATSSDGINWTKEAGERKQMATFPDIIKLADSQWRMYFQNAGVIKSAVSADGLTWTDEPGTRIDKAESGYNLESVGAQSTTILSDGSYAMVYRGTINEPYQTSEKIPNQTTQIYFWATSTDGLTWQKKGLAFDSRNETLYGLSDGAEWVKWSNEELRVYFWSYTGIYYIVYKDGTFSVPVFDWTNNKDTKMKFSPNPPSDPTLIEIGGEWFMYYGQHEKGIYYTTLQ